VPGSGRGVINLQLHNLLEKSIQHRQTLQSGCPDSQYVYKLITKLMH